MVPNEISSVANQDRPSELPCWLISLMLINSISLLLWAVQRFASAAPCGSHHLRCITLLSCIHNYTICIFKVNENVNKFFTGMNLPLIEYYILDTAPITYIQIRISDTY